MNSKEGYQEIILEHGKNPRNLRKTENFNKDAMGKNPLCGDNVHVFLKLDMQDIDCDFYAISCHKMYGPTGLGVLYAKKKWLEQLPPYQGGGGMINDVKKDSITYGDLPNKYEAGTMATAQVIAFDQSIKFLEKVGIESMIKHEQELIEYGQEILKRNNSVKLIGNPKNRAAVLSFTIEGVHPHDIATILDEDGVAIRAGHHCCQILHDKLGISASAQIGRAHV